MKRLILSMTVVCTPFVVALAIPKHSATFWEANKPEVQEAQRKGAEAKVVYQVVDDEGSPLANQKVGYRFQNDYPRKTWGGYVITDTNGVVVLQDKVGSQMMVSANREGYYGAGDKILFFCREGVSPLVKDGKWQPYGEHRTLLVKRIKAPVEMKFHNWGSDGYRAPATNVWIGLDFEAGQWCKPYGNGKHDDVLVRFSGTIVDDFTWDTKTEISFENVPYAGFYMMQKDAFSTMKTCYTALTNDSAYAERMITFTSKGRKGISPNKQTTDKIAADKYLVFRTRCIIDEKGRLVSAHYGKINGEFGGLLELLFNTHDSVADEAGIYLNMTPNDPNVEDGRNVRLLSRPGK